MFFKLKRLLLPKLRLGKRFMSFGIPGLDSGAAEHTTIKHTPIFSRALQNLLLPKDVGRRDDKEYSFLDLTFGDGGHSALLLDSFKNYDEASKVKVIAVDSDHNAVSSAERLADSYPRGQLVAFQSRFSEVPFHLDEMLIEEKSFDGIVIDTGVSDLQWSDKRRGFCHLRKGKLDLRRDNMTGVTASEVLQHISDRDLTRLLKRYGGLKQKSRHIANAIVEARYMFHRFQTTQELCDVLNSAARSFAKSDDVADMRLVQEMMLGTITALRMFVNDEINQLDFGINNVATNYVAPGGILAVVVHSEVEQKLVAKLLTEVNVPYNVDLSDLEIERLSLQNTWETLHVSPPLRLSEADKTLYPRLANAAMFVARRNSVEDTRSSNI